MWMGYWNGKRRCRFSVVHSMRYAPLFRFESIMSKYNIALEYLLCANRQTGIL